jgi:hypothetical protein
MGRCECEGKAPDRLRGKPACGFARDMSGMVVENDFDRGIGWVEPAEYRKSLDRILRDLKANAVK